MPNYRGVRPAILWGSGFANTLLAFGGLDMPGGYPEPRAGSEFVQAVSGVEDSWIVGTDQYLEGELRWIPRIDGTNPKGQSVTGWEGAAGVAAFLTWARAKNVFRFAPDAAALGTYWPMYLVEPMNGPPTFEKDSMSRRLKLRMRTSDGSTPSGY